MSIRVVEADPIFEESGALRCICAVYQDERGHKHVVDLPASVALVYAAQIVSAVERAVSSPAVALPRELAP